MTLPETLKEAINKEISGISIHQLTEAREQLSSRYRSGSVGPHAAAMTSLHHRQAYITTRMPATYAVVSRVLEEIPLWAPEAKIQTMLDLGSGPGTASWAASVSLPELASITLVEKDSDLIALGKRLAKTSEASALTSATWQLGDLNQNLELVPHDLTILSYVIGELSKEKLKALFTQAWYATKQFMVVIEPGTPKGYDYILTARHFLLDSGAHLIAPCSHQAVCPMEGANTWCHFPQRVERTGVHRKAKGGALGYEDEKYSYIIGARLSGIKYPSRIVGHPQKRSGHVCLTLCNEKGIQQETISRKEGDMYRLAKKADWGEAFDR